jgi:hypothetical protein
LSHLSDNVQSEMLLKPVTAACSKQNTDQSNPTGMDGLHYTSQCRMEESPDTKRKVVRAEQQEPDCAKRQRTVMGSDVNETVVPVEVQLNLDESIDLIQDIVAVWTQRTQAMQRIESLLSNSATLVSAEASDRLFKGFAAQVDFTAIPDHLPADAHAVDCHRGSEWEELCGSVAPSTSLAL